MEVRFCTTSNTKDNATEFIEGLSVKARKKIIRQLKLLEEYGYKYVDMKKLKGYDLYQISINFNNICYRILCVIKEAVCWLLHIFIKKSNHTPQREINTALSRARNLGYS